MTKTPLLILLCLGLFGCTTETPTSPAEPQAAVAPAPIDFGEFGALAQAIRANPAEADVLLEAAGYTIERFEAELIAIAQDPAHAAAWASQMQ